MGADDFGPVLGIALGAGAGAGLVGAVLLWLLRRRSITVSLTIVVLTAVSAMVGGTALASQQMFLSHHDTRVVLVVVAVTGVVGVIVAVLLGRSVVSGTRRMGSLAHDIGSGTLRGRRPLPPTAELATLASDLEDADRRLAEAWQRERALERSRRELIAWMSHDLRTPLAGLRAMAEALQDGVVDDDPVAAARYQARILAATDRLSGMVDDLFELSRVSAGAPDPSAGAVSLSDLVSDALATASPIADTRGIALTGHADAQTPPIVGSAADLARALDNLVTNALRHTPRGNAVRVWAEPADDPGDTTEGAAGGRLIVQDSCGGIPEQDLPRVFDVAFRGSADRSPDDGGAGLGLAITRAIAEAHGGQVSVSNVDGGCRFVVQLPAVQRAGRGADTGGADTGGAGRSGAAANSAIPAAKSTSAR